jgi:hypothetical protein
MIEVDNVGRHAARLGQGTNSNGCLLDGDDRRQGGGMWTKREGNFLWVDNVCRSHDKLPDHDATTGEGKVSTRDAPVDFTVLPYLSDPGRAP